LSIASSFTQDLFKAEQSLQLCKVCKFNHDIAGFLKKTKKNRLKAKTKQNSVLDAQKQRGLSLF